LNRPREPVQVNGQERMAVDFDAGPTARM